MAGAGRRRAGAEAGDGLELGLGGQTPVGAACQCEIVAVDLGVVLVDVRRRIGCHPAQTSARVAEDTATALQGRNTLPRAAGLRRRAILGDGGCAPAVHGLAARAVGAISLAIVVHLPRHHVAVAGARQAARDSLRLTDEAGRLEARLRAFATAGRGAGAGGSCAAIIGGIGVCTSAVAVTLVRIAVAPQAVVATLPAGEVAPAGRAGARVAATTRIVRVNGPVAVAGACDQTVPGLHRVLALTVGTGIGRARLVVIAHRRRIGGGT